MVKTPPKKVFWGGFNYVFPSGFWFSKLVPICSYFV